MAFNFWCVLIKSVNLCHHIFPLWIRLVQVIISWFSLLHKIVENSLPKTRMTSVLYQYRSRFFLKLGKGTGNARYQYGMVPRHKFGKYRYQSLISWSQFSENLISVPVPKYSLRYRYYLLIPTKSQHPLVHSVQVFENMDPSLCQRYIFVAPCSWYSLILGSGTRIGCSIV